MGLGFQAPFAIQQHQDTLDKMLALRKADELIKQK